MARAQRGGDEDGEVGGREPTKTTDDLWMCAEGERIVGAIPSFCMCISVGSECCASMFAPEMSHNLIQET